MCNRGIINSCRRKLRPFFAMRSLFSGSHDTISKNHSNKKKSDKKIRYKPSGNR